LSFIGAASATGQATNLPILTRSLADYFFLPGTETILEFDESLTAFLDAGIDVDSPYGLANSYLNDWWNGKSKSERQWLIPANLPMHIAYHRKQRDGDGSTTAQVIAKDTKQHKTS
jgi:long-subunit fatty acid transport protein